MDRFFTKPEKTVLIMLSFLLLIGALILHVRESRPRREITLVKNGVKEELTLEQVENMLNEGRKVNINTAGIEKLMSIPGVGKVLASKIIEYRNLQGDFKTGNDLLAVEGVGKKKLKKIRDYVKYRK